MSETMEVFWAVFAILASAFLVVLLAALVSIAKDAIVEVLQEVRKTRDHDRST